MRIVVTEMPKRAYECPFSMHPLIRTEHDRKILQKCYFKVNHSHTDPPISWGFAPDKYTCDLCEEKECPYLIVNRLLGRSHERKR